MVRPKKNTKAGELATERWRETMKKKYGDISEKMAKVGKKGGTNGKGPDYKGGFASNHNLARIAGAKGGRISRRGISVTDTELKKRIPEILELYEKEFPMTDISRKLNLPYAKVRGIINKWRG